MTHSNLTAEKSRELLALAVSRGLVARPTRDPKIWTVNSATRKGLIYVVTPTGCSCEAGKRGVACSHFVAVAKAAQERKATERPQPTPPAGAVACAGGCGKVGRPLQDKPIGGPVYCPACKRAAASVAA